MEGNGTRPVQKCNDGGFSWLCRHHTMAAPWERRCEHGDRDRDYDQEYDRDRHQGWR